MENKMKRRCLALQSQKLAPSFFEFGLFSRMISLTFFLAMA